MPSSFSQPKEKESSYKGDVDQHSFLSGPQDLSMSSYSTITSGLGSLLPLFVRDRKRKMMRKNLAASADEVTDESNSAEFKVFEGFLLSQYTHLSENLDLTGLEDPKILHAVIATQTSQTAYREVQKFRKRPQYLEFFVYLANSTLAKGHIDWVMDWSKEVFLWLTRRNELLLISKPHVPAQSQTFGNRGTSSKPIPKQQFQSSSCTAVRSASACLLRRRDLSPVSNKKQTKLTVPLNNRQLMASNSKLTNGNKRGVVLLGASLNVPKQVANKPKGSMLLSRSVLAKLKKFRPIMPTKLLDMSLNVKITREDLETKAVLVLVSLMPAMWQKHKARWACPSPVNTCMCY